MVVRTYTETYDMNTAIDELNIYAIHTPQAASLKKMFRGHFINYRKYKILGCDINMACAQQLPLSPELVGMESGMVDPRDVMNPMLFKACTGENLNLLLNQIYNQGEETQTGSSVGEHIDRQQTALDAYYQLLADGSFRKAHPQQGLRIRNLKPFVHKVVTTQPFKWNGLPGVANSGNAYVGDRPLISANGLNSADTVLGFGSPSSTFASTPADSSNPTVFVSNGITSMPWLDTAVPQTITYAEEDTEHSTITERTASGHWLINNVPRVYCGCLIMPPAHSTKFYMRMAIRWRVAFKDFRPAYELGAMQSVDIIDSMNGINSDVNTSGSQYTTYWNLIHDEGTKEIMAKESDNFHEESSFTTNGTEDVNMVTAQPF